MSATIATPARTAACVGADGVDGALHGARGGPHDRRGGHEQLAAPLRIGRCHHARERSDHGQGARVASVASGGVKALAKSEARPGIWLDDVPEPEVGINDVLIQVLRTGICGTDLHIYKWDAWAQKTIPVPMVVGHEFVGEIVEVGSNVNDFHAGRHRQRRGPRRLRPLPQLPGRPPASVHGHAGRRRQPRRARSPSTSRCR